MDIDSARYRFLQAVRAVCPTALCDLRDQVYPVYSKWVARRIARSAPQGDAPEYRSFVLVRKVARPVAAAIDRWCEKHHLIGAVETEPDHHGDQWEEVARARSLWPQQWATETLWAWCSWPEGLDMRNASPPEWVRVSFEFGVVGNPTVTLAVRVHSWISEVETKTEFRQRALDSLDRKIDDYSARRGSLGHDRRVRAVEGNPHVWEWVALRQVAGLKYSEIAKRYIPSGALGDDTVRKAVETKATQIGLALRPGRRGPKRRKPER